MSSKRLRMTPRTRTRVFIANDSAFKVTREFLNQSIATFENAKQFNGNSALAHEVVRKLFKPFGNKFAAKCGIHFASWYAEQPLDKEHQVLCFLQIYISDYRKMYPFNIPEEFECVKLHVSTELDNFFENFPKKFIEQYQVHYKKECDTQLINPKRPDNLLTGHKQSMNLRNDIQFAQQQFAEQQHIALVAEQNLKDDTDALWVDYEEWCAWYQEQQSR
jgi:hypothetical protein